MASEINKYLDNMGKIKSSKEGRKCQFVRLVSFKELPKDCILPATQLSHLGFFYDPKVHAIRCSECKFNFENMKISLVKELVYHHNKFNEKCANIESQIHLIKDMLDRESIEMDAQKDQEKVQKQMANKDNRLGSFKDIELKINNHRLVENGFYMDKKTSTTSSPIMIRCAFCSYNCFIFSNYHLNCRFEDPFEEHKTTSPDCLLVIELNKLNLMDCDETGSFNNAKFSINVTETISPEAINSRLNLPAVLKIMDLGIKRNTLKQVIEKKLKEDGKDYDILDLVKACEKHDENAKRLHEELKKPTSKNGSSQITSLSEVFSTTENDETVSKRSIEISNIQDDAAQSTKKKKSDSFQTHDLKEEIVKIEKENECVACMDRIKGTLCPPCQHLAMCIECSATLKNCPTYGVKLKID